MESGSDLSFPVVGLEGNLQDPVSQGIAVEGLDGHQGLLVVGHRHEAKPLTLVGLQVSDHLDVLHCSKWPKQLPQYVLLCLRRQVIHEYTQFY